MVSNRFEDISLTVCLTRLCISEPFSNNCITMSVNCVNDSS